MSEAMQILFDYVSFHGVNAYLPARQDHFYASSLEALEEALLSTMSEAQKASREAWRKAQLQYNILYEQAVFQAAFTLAKELG